jgi:hypothetical protein
MNNTFIFLLMIFCHIVDDYYLQATWLSSGKQKTWWQENAPNKLYKYDYIWALLMHSFSWSFMIMLPIAFVYEFNISKFFVYIFILNVIVHAITDNEKANKFTINLWADQLIHLSQITLTALFLL